MDADKALAELAWREAIAKDLASNVLAMRRDGFDMPIHVVDLALKVSGDIRRSDCANQSMESDDDVRLLRGVPHQQRELASLPNLHLLRSQAHSEDQGQAADQGAVRCAGEYRLSRLAETRPQHQGYVGAVRSVGAFT